MNLKSNDVFISSRQEDKLFVQKLTYALRDSGFSIWNDTNTLAPNAAAYRSAAEEGIRRSHNFIYILSPNSIVSEICLFEILHARKLRKPILTVVTKKPTVEDESKFIHPYVSESIWVNFDRSVFEDKYATLAAEINKRADFKKMHTVLLEKAETWENNKKKPAFLLSGKERIIAENWLTDKSEETNYGAIFSQAQFICASRKHIEGGMSDLYFCYAGKDIRVADKVAKLTTLLGYTTWSNRDEMQIVCKHAYTQRELILKTDTFLFFLSSSTFNSDEYLQELRFAQQLNKRIITIKVDDLSQNNFPNGLKSTTVIDFTVHKDSNLEVTLHYGLGMLQRKLEEFRAEHRTHKELTIKAINWDKHRIESLLLKGYQLVQAEAWLQKTKTISCCKPLPIIEDYIENSAKRPSPQYFDVFIVYAPEDFAVARRLCNELQVKGKNVWFDPKELVVANENDSSTEQLIIKSHSVVLIISAQSFESDHFVKEVEWAQKWQKEILLVFTENVPLGSLPPDIQYREFIDAQYGNGLFQNVVNEVLQNLNGQNDLVRGHTKWLAPAIQWKEKKNDPYYLLSELEAREADKWLNEVLDQAITNSSIPIPVPEHQDFIRNSVMQLRKKEKRKRRSLYVSYLIIALAVLVIGKLVFQLFQAEDNYQEVGTHLLAYEAHSLHEKDPTLSLRLAEAAYRFNPEENNTYKSLLHSYLSNDTHYDILYSSEKEINSVEFSPDNRSILIATAENKAFIFDTEGKELARFGHNDEVWSAKFSPDGKYVLTTSQDATVKIWHTNGDPVRTIEFRSPVYDADFSPDGDKFVCCGDESEIELYNFQGKRLAQFKGHENGINLVRFSDNGKRILSLSDDATVRLWNTAGNELYKLQFDAIPTSADFGLNDSTVLIAGNSEQTGIWSVQGKKIRRLPSEGGANYIYRNGKSAIITADNDKVIRMWDESGKLLQEFKGHTVDINAVNIHSQGKQLVSVSGKRGEVRNSLRLWNLRPSPPFIQIKRENSTITTADYSPDGKYFAICIANTIEIFDREGKLMSQFDAAEDITDIAFMSDGRSIFTGHSSNIIRQFTWEGKLIRELESTHVAVNSLDVSPSGEYLVSVGINPLFLLWKLKDGTSKQFIAHEEAINHIEFSKDGRRFITASDDSLAKVWDLDGEIRHILKGHTGALTSASFSNDGKQFITTSCDSTAIIWNNDGEIEKRIKSHNDMVMSACFSYDGNYLATAAYDNTTRFWTINGELIHKFEATSDLVYQNKVLYSPDNEFLLVISNDQLKAVGNATIYRMNPEKILKHLNTNDGSTQLWKLDKQHKKQYHILQ